MQCGMDDVSVNVCDICGDIGDEEKLAICSRCNDGAEHTYCMQVMIEDVPEGAWFCEECRAEVDIEEKHKKLEKSQVKAGIVSSKTKAGIEHVAVPNGRIKKWRELKHCGICGDVGEQEKLAICSRCNDGAEHIYCMRVMMEEVPDVWWLCEACQSEVESGKKTNKLQKCQDKDGIFKGLSAEGKLINPSNKANIRSSSKYQMNVKYVGGEESGIGSQDNYMVTERKEAEAGATSCARQNLHEPGGLSVEDDSRKTVLSRGSSFEFNMEKGKHAPVQVSNSLAPNAPKAQLDHVCPLTVTKETRVLNQLGSQNVKNNRGSTIAHSSVSASVVAQVASQAESSGQYELKNLVFIKEPGSRTLSSGKRSAGFLGPDPKREAVQVSHHFHEEYNTNCPTLKVKGYDTAYMVGRSLDSPIMSSDPGDKKLVFCSQDVSPGYEKIASAIPEKDYFWQGSFEVWGLGTLPQFCDGLQGHISCSASPKLLDVAKKFPSNIQLQQLPRQNVWPSEFQENYPTCDSIDIFFFARDIQSYENYYSKLVEIITKDDLALTGNIETAELIILSSGTLPENFERWNTLYFLWGVLRVK